MAEWTKVSSEDTWFGEFDTYLNYAKVKDRNGNYIIRMLTNRHDDGEPDYKLSYKSAILSLEIDCQKSLWKVLEHIDYKELWASGSSLSLELIPRVTEWQPNSRHGAAEEICERLN